MEPRLFSPQTATVYNVAAKVPKVCLMFGWLVGVIAKLSKTRFSTAPWIEQNRVLLASSRETENRASIGF